MKKILCLGLLLFVFMASAKIKVSYVGGEAYLKRNANSQRITFGMILRQGDVIVTRASSFVALKLSDGSVHKITANTIYKIKEYQVTSSSRKHVFSIISGKVFSYVSKTFKSSVVKILTPTAAVGVRGTTFVTQYQNGETDVFMLSGRVSIASANGLKSVSVEKGKMATINSKSIKVKVMNKSDEENAYGGVPSAVAEVVVKKALKGADADELKQLVNEATLRNDEQNANNSKLKVWDYQTQKTAGNFRIVQNISTLNDRQIIIKTRTADLDKEQQTVLNLKMHFDESIPTYSDALSGQTRNLEKIDWDITVANATVSDNLFYSKDYVNSSDKVFFNGKKGDHLSTESYRIDKSNIKIPKDLLFDIDGEAYEFNFKYSFVSDSQIAKLIKGRELQDFDKKDVYQQVANGDLSTRIIINAKKVGGVGGANLLNSNGTSSFTIIVLNGFLIPLFNQLSS